MQGPYRSVVNENNAHVLHTERPVYVCHDDGIERDGDISHPGSVLTKAVLVEDSELRSCVKDEVAVTDGPYRLFGRNAVLPLTELLRQSLGVV